MPHPQLICIADLRYVFGCIADRVPRGGSGWYDADGRYHPVANLAWLERHADDVHDLFVSTTSYVHIGVAMPRRVAMPLRTQGVGFDAILAARLTHGRVYTSTFADATVLHAWLNRPAYIGRPVSWEHRALIVGSRDYERLAWERRQRRHRTNQGASS